MRESRRHGTPPHGGPMQAGAGELASSGVSKERVGGLFDGIVAITATLLILDIGVTAQTGELTLADLRASLVAILHWAVSFVMVAMIWTEFHFVFAHTRQWDGGLLVVTFAQMALISLVPFAAELVGDHPQNLIAALVFAAVMGANGLFVALNISILLRKAHLHMNDRSRDHLGRRMRAQLLVYSLMLSVSLATAALHDPLFGILAWALCPVALAVYLRLSARQAATVREAGA